MTDHLRAVFLNCTLKRSPDVSNTEALMRKVIEWFDRMDVETRHNVCKPLIPWIMYKDSCVVAPFCATDRYPVAATTTG